MFPIPQSSALFPGRTRARAHEVWREAADLVAIRWCRFVEAEGAAREWAFAAYVAALDAEQAAAFEMAALSPRAAA
jgi:hypothetical protein